MNAARTRTTKIAKSRQNGALIVLRAVRDNAGLTEEQLRPLISRKAHAHTWCHLEDLRAMGLLAGHGQHPDFRAGIPLTYSITALGLAVASWS